MDKRFLVLADIHIGSINDTNYVYNVMENIIDKEIAYKKTDAIIILGDLFHKNISLSSDHTKCAMDIINHLVRVCKKNKTKIRMVYGTESHDAHQYETTFRYFLTDPLVDMKIIYHVYEEELFPNINVLYLPEEYINDKYEYYKDYLYSNKKYDFIFGHLSIREGMPMLQFVKENKSNREKKVPIFNSNELSTVANITLAGHYHVNSIMEDNVIYVGSLFRDRFGEEKPKGYYVIEDNKLSFIENERAYIYKTFIYEENSPVYESTDNIIKEINNIKEEYIDLFNNVKFGKIRMLFKVPSDIDSTFKDTIRNLLMDNSIIYYNIKETTMSSEDIEEIVKNEYDFILDSSLPLVDKIHQFLLKQYEIDMSIDEINDMINIGFKI